MFDKKQVICELTDATERNEGGRKTMLMMRSCLKVGRLVSCILYLCIIVGTFSVHAGQEIINESIYIDDLPPHYPVTQGNVVELCYSSSRYVFSGMRNEYVYTVFVVSPKIDIEGSVGQGGKNNPGDIRTIKKRLRELRFYDGPINGISNESFIRSIRKFQREVAGQSPDGRVDVGGKTIRVLRIETSDHLFVKLTKIIGYDREYRRLRECVNFIAPYKVAKYDIIYCQLSLIIDYPIGTEVARNGKTITILNSNEERFIKRHLLQYAYSMQGISSLTVVPRETQEPHPFTTYLKINDKTLVLETKVAPGFSENPLRFSWYVTPEYHGQVQYRFRLTPQQEKWSQWSDRTETEYYFLAAGTHAFEVGARYKDNSGKWREIPRLDYQFTLKRAFVSKPILKASVRARSSNSVDLPPLNRIYSGSKALLVGIGEFQDWKSFKPLEYVEQDIVEMERVLKKLGFDVRALQGQVRREKIMASIEELIESADSSDRIIIYFSTHGFSDHIVKSRAYIAPYDCHSDAPAINCIELDYLENVLKRAIEKPVKHILIILDACSSGLGVIAKDVNYKEIRVAMENGSHMLTAGMADQKAHMEHKIKMSTFTRHLTQGLAGEADLIEDGVISLSELLLYVRYQVARSTDGAQTPMMGRMSGVGEMIFDIK